MMDEGIIRNMWSCLQKYNKSLYSRISLDNYWPRFVTTLDIDRSVTGIEILIQCIRLLSEFEIAPSKNINKVPVYVKQLK